MRGEKPDPNHFVHFSDYSRALARWHRGEAPLAGERRLQHFTGSNAKGERIEGVFEAPVFRIPQGEHEVTVISSEGIEPGVLRDNTIEMRPKEEKEPEYVIWSHEHNKWWAANSSGYTDDLAQAGRYGFRFAADIALNTLPPGMEIAVREEVAVSGWEIHGAKPRKK